MNENIILHQTLCENSDKAMSIADVGSKVPSTATEFDGRVSNSCASEVTRQILAIPWKKCQQARKQTPSDWASLVS